MTVTTTAEAERDLLDRVPTGLHVDGAWTPASDGSTFAVVDPSTGEVIAHVADATAEDGLRALAAADAAQPAWGRTAPRVRAEILRRAFELVTAHTDDLALLITLEMGKPL